MTLQKDYSPLNVLSNIIVTNNIMVHTNLGIVKNSEPDNKALKYLAKLVVSTIKRTIVMEIKTFSVAIITVTNVSLLAILAKAPPIIPPAEQKNVSWN